MKRTDITTEALDLNTWPIFYAMSKRGMMVSLERLDALKAEVAAKAQEQLELVEFYAERPINPSSGDQVAAWLTEQGYTGKLTKETHRLATDERSLSQMPHHPAIAAMIEYRGLRKLEGTFIDPIIEIAHKNKVEGLLCGTVHPKWRLTRVKSGRVATEDPNLLAFPSRDEMGKKVRGCFVARPGFRLLSVDFSQLEPRIVAALSKDPKLLQIYAENRDLYSEVSADLGGIIRLAAKVLTLGVLYGMSPQRLFEQLQLVGCFTDDRPTYDLEACAALIENWFNTYAGVKRLVQETVLKARRNRGAALTYLGRPRHLPGLFLEGWGWPTAKLREEAERQAFNHLVQGTGMEMLKLAIVRVADAALAGVFPLLLIHDEGVFEIADEAYPNAVNAIRELFECNFEGVDLKCSASVADDWGGLK